MLTFTIGLLIGTYLTGSLWAYVSFMSAWYDTSGKEQARWRQQREGVLHGLAWPWTLVQTAREIMQEER